MIWKVRQQKILYTYWNASSKTMFSNLMGNYTKKIIGTAMGSVPSPEDCDILMFDILEEINNRSQFKHKIYCLLCSVFSKRWMVYAARTNTDVCAQNYLYPVFLLTKTQPRGFYQWILIKDTPLPDWQDDQAQELGYVVYWVHL